MSRPTTIYRFGCFQLDAADRLLYRDGELVPLAPKILDTLLILVEHSGHVVTKEEFTRQLWPDTFVADGALTQSISLLRKALGDGGKVIENHPRRGYRFNAAVERTTVGRVPAMSADRVEDENPPGNFAGTLPPLTTGRLHPARLRCSLVDIAASRFANGRLTGRTLRVVAAVSSYWPAQDGSLPAERLPELRPRSHGLRRGLCD